MIVGSITSAGVLAHPILVCKGFGVACLLRCWWAILTMRRTTFLALAHPAR